MPLVCCGEDVKSKLEQTKRCFKLCPSSRGPSFGRSLLHLLLVPSGLSAVLSRSVVASAHNAMVVSCFIRSKYYPSGSHHRQYPEHLADSVCTLGPASALHLHPSSSICWREMGLPSSLIFSTRLSVLSWSLESLPSKHHCKRCDQTSWSKIWNLKMFNLAFLASEWPKKTFIFLFSFLNISKEKSFCSWQRFCGPTFRAKYWFLSRGF